MKRTRPYVLVVDDLPDAADSTAQLLALWGHEAVARYSGAAGLAAVALRWPAVVLLDIGMPQMNGFEFLARLRELPGGAGLPVIVHSGYTCETFRKRAHDLGVTHYLFKPAEPEALRVILERHLRGSAVAGPRGLSYAWLERAGTC